MKRWPRTWWRDTNATQYIYKRGCGVLVKKLYEPWTQAHMWLTKCFNQRNNLGSLMDHMFVRYEMFEKRICEKGEICDKKVDARSKARGWSVTAIEQWKNNE